MTPLDSAPSYGLVTPADHAARSGALLAPPADLGTLSVTLADRLTWLQGVLTCDVNELAPGDGRWGLLLTRQGKIVADVIVVADSDAVRLGIVRSAVERAREHLSSFLVMEDAELSDDSERLAWITLHGPEAHRVVRTVSERFEGAAFAPVDSTGLGGAALVLPRESEPAARRALLDAGAVAATDEDLARLRVERLVPLYGVDMDEARSPHEVSLERRAVSWSKGCYLGQEAVCMQDMRGKVKRRLAVMRIDGGGLPAPGASVLDAAGVQVGETRSAVRSTVLGGVAALALLSAASAVIGTRLSVGGSPAEVVAPK